VPTHQGHPDVTFEMKLIRHFRETAAFPAGSHPFSVSQHSSFPATDSSNWTRNASFTGDDWQELGLAGHHHENKPEPYEGVAGHESMPREPSSDELDQNLPSTAEVDFRVELVAPFSVVPGQVGQSALFLTNEGQDPIPRVDVIDNLDQLQTVVDAN